MAEEVKRISNKTQITNGNTTADLSQNDLLLSQHRTGDNKDYSLTLAEAQSIPYGTASILSGNTYSLSLINYPSDYDLRVGSKILVKFNTAKSGAALSLAFNSKTYPLMLQGTALTELAANQIVEFTAYGTIDASGVHTVTGLNASIGVTPSQLNNALANLNTVKFATTITQTNIDVLLKDKANKTYWQIFDQINGSQGTAPSNYGFVQTLVWNSGRYATQLFIEGDTTRKLYARYYNNGTWGSWQKLTTESELNSAVTALKKTDYSSTITDCNDAYEEGSMSRYVLNTSNTTHLPETSGTFIVESISSNSTLSSNNYGYQIATKIGNISKSGDRYIRYRNSSSKTWYDWEKVATSTDLNDRIQYGISQNDGRNSDIYLLLRQQSIIDNNYRFNLLFHVWRPHIKVYMSGNLQVGGQYQNTDVWRRLEYIIGNRGESAKLQLISYENSVYLALKLMTTATDTYVRFYNFGDKIDGRIISADDVTTVYNDLATNKTPIIG